MKKMKKIKDTLYLSVFSLNAGKSGKNVDQNNSEYGLFLRNVYQNTLAYVNCYAS